MTNRFSKIVLLGVLAATIIGCKDPDDFSDTPFLEYRGFELVPDPDPNIVRPTLIHELYFTDGDGDIGDRLSLNGDSCSIDNYDIRSKYFRQVNGTFIEITPVDTCTPFANHIPDLTPTGTNKVLEGTIFNPFDLFTPGPDSVKFEFVLVDRAGNSSNIVITPSLIIQ